MRDRPHDESMAEVLREDPEYALELLNAVLEDGEQSESFVLIRQFAKAFPELQQVAQASGIDLNTAYGGIFPSDLPELAKLRTVMGAMRQQLPVSPMRAA